MELGQIDSMSADEGARLYSAPSFGSNKMYFYSFYDCTSSEYVQQIDLPLSCMANFSLLKLIRR